MLMVYQVAGDTAVRETSRDAAPDPTTRSEDEVWAVARDSMLRVHVAADVADDDALRKHCRHCGRRLRYGCSRGGTSSRSSEASLIVTMHDPIVCRTLFLGEIWRDVYEQPDGRQYVLDEDDEPVYGVWYIPQEMPEPDAVVNGSDDVDSRQKRVAND
jgi:hypothetical protein